MFPTLTIPILYKNHVPPRIRIQSNCAPQQVESRIRTFHTVAHKEAGHDDLLCLLPCH